MSRQKGFTIIEVMLFLAISGGLFFIVLRSTSGTISNVRNDDARNSLVSFLQKQYNNVATSNVERPLRPGEKVTCSSTPGTAISVTMTGNGTTQGISDTCAIVGVEIVMNEDWWNPSQQKYFKVYPVLAYLNPPTSSVSPARGFYLSNPQTWKDQKAIGQPDFDRVIDTYQMPWDAYWNDRKLMQMTWKDPSHGGHGFFDWWFTSFAFSRNHVSDSVDVTFMNNTFGVDNIVNASQRAVSNEDLNELATRRNVPAAICIVYPNDSNRRDVVLFKGNGTGEAFTIDDIEGRVGIVGDDYMTDVIKPNEGELDCG